MSYIERTVAAGEMVGWSKRLDGWWNPGVISIENDWDDVFPEPALFVYGWSDFGGGCGLGNLVTL